jgi:cytidylate kinase
MGDTPNLTNVPDDQTKPDSTAAGSEKQSPADQMQAVTISREYGSGGGEIAARLADRLGWHLVDHEVVVEVARALGISEDEAEAHDEQADTLVSRILAGLSMVQSPVPVSVPIQFGTDQPAYDEARRQVVEGAVTTGHTVIVGRGAQVLLSPRRDVLHVRIIAPLAQRIDYVMAREGMSRAEAEQRIRNKDQVRAHFLMSVHHRNPADAQLYDLVINTGVLSLDSAIDLLVLALERKAARLADPAEALGPGTGLAPYVEAPADTGPLSN